MSVREYTARKYRVLFEVDDKADDNLLELCRLAAIRNWHYRIEDEGYKPLPEEPSATLHVRAFEEWVELDDGTEVKLPDRMWRVTGWVVEDSCPDPLPTIRDWPIVGPLRVADALSDPMSA